MKRKISKKYQRPTTNQMLNTVFDEETIILKHAFKHYNKRAHKYIAGKPSPEEAKLNLNKAFENLILVMNSQTIVSRFEKLIVAGAEINYQTIKELMLGISPEDLEKELNLAELFDIDKRNIKQVIESHENDPYQFDRVTSTADIIDHMDGIHDEFIVETEKSRAIVPRVEKKKRKRNIALAISTSIFGAGCGLVNTYVVVGMPMAPTSYGAMIGAFGLALRDIIGDKPKE